MDESSLRIILSKLGVEVTGTSAYWIQAKCPLSPFFHTSGKDSRPSFGVSFYPDEISGYFCHTCKWHGKISDLAQTLGHYRHKDISHYRDIIQEANSADRANVVFSDYDDLPKRRDPPQEPLVEEIFDNMYEFPIVNEEAIGYLTSRGISSKTTETLGLRWDARQRRILFPIRNPSNALMGFSGRAISEENEPKVRDYAGLKKRQHILGCNRWDWENSRKPLVIVEGLFGFAHLVELNVEKVADVGALLGSHLTEKKEELIAYRDTRTFLLSDNDDAGEQFLFGRRDAEGNFNFDSGAISKLSKHGIPIYVPVWPDAKADPDELTKRDIWDMIQYTDLWS